MCCDELKTILEAKGKESCFSNASAAKERGKRFAFSSKARKNICRVRVDDCLITSKQIKKCDYFFKICEDDRYYLVEFKGGAVDTAVEQIVNTYDLLNAKINALPERFSGIIVSSSVPAGTEQKFRRLQEKFYREKKFRITKTSHQHTEKI